MGKIFMYIIAFLGVYIGILNLFYNLFKEARIKLTTHYKFYGHDTIHVTTRKVVNFLEERVIAFPKEANMGIRTDARIMPYIIDDLKRYKRIILVLNVATLGIFQYLS